MLPKGDADFRKLVDDAIAEAQTGGDAGALSTKCFAEPLPPKGVNLQWPMSDEQKSLFASLNDKPGS